MFRSDHEAFLKDLFAALEQDGIAVEHLPLDHLCYRVATMERYHLMHAALSAQGKLLNESAIGGRAIATFRLAEPLRHNARPIDIIELPAPKPNNNYEEGFEHAEFVVAMEPLAFAAKYPGDWDLAGAEKPVNPDVRKRYGRISAKFHTKALETVIANEQAGK